nr:MAG: hypothetical protein DIU78_21180 [Pseudomonadota bacterium]
MARPGSGRRSAPSASGARRRLARFAALACLVVSALLALGCGLLRGTVNASPSLRWWLFSNFGAGRLCPEMLKRSASLKLATEGNTIGRFFPDGCVTTVNQATQTITLDFTGTGYAWTPVAGRVGFRAGAAIDYRMDFYMAEDAVYVWAVPARVLRGPEFQMTAIEYSLANFAAQGPAGYLLNTFGAQLMNSQLATGFTVIHGDDGDEFALGRLSPPQRPKSPFVRGADRYVFANEITEIKSGQVDFLGPFEVVDDDQALFLRLRVTGPAVDAFVVPRSSGDVWRKGLELGTPLGPPPSPPVSTWVVPSGPERQDVLRLPPGQYYVVIENGSRLGTVNPPWTPLGVIGGNIATVAYLAELGEVD